MLWSEFFLGIRFKNISQKKNIFGEKFFLCMYVCEHTQKRNEPDRLYLIYRFSTKMDIYQILDLISQP